MKTLIIHHLQPMWDSGLQKYGTDFETELQKVCEHLDENNYNNVDPSLFILNDKNKSIDKNYIEGTLKNYGVI